MKNIYKLLPGTSISICIAVISLLLSPFLHVSYVLIALIAGFLSKNFFSKKKFKPGIDFSADFLLKFGVGLMGLKFSYKNFISIGLSPIIFIFILILLIILSGILLSKIFRKETSFGLLSGGAVAICGASAAVAIFSVFSRSSNLNNYHLSIVILGTTLLSTISMILYPLVFTFFITSNIELGFLLGTSIHDTVGVVGAGYTLNNDIGFYSTFFKMIRISFLPVILTLIILFFKGSKKKKFFFPWFLILFFSLAIFRNILKIPDELISSINLISIFLILVSISSIGLKGNLFSIKGLGSTYFLILFLETLIILCLSYFFVNIYF